MIIEKSGKRIGIGKVRRKKKDSALLKTTKLYRGGDLSESCFEGLPRCKNL